MSSPIRFGILGCGRITRRGLVPGITGSPVAQLYALASERPGVAAALAAECGATRVYDSYDAVLADPQVDAVYIPTTGETHGDHPLRLGDGGGERLLAEHMFARRRRLERPF
ncbi:MAG: Gfo/Idh/MocA family oxidoreductase, partial [Planctomycetaceae bacterium]